MKDTVIHSVLLLFLLLTYNNHEQIVQENNPIFHTTDPSQSFSQNTRNHLYSMITQKATKIDHYYLESMDERELPTTGFRNKRICYWNLGGFPFFVAYPMPKKDKYEMLELNSEDRKMQYEFYQ